MDGILQSLKQAVPLLVAMGKVDPLIGLLVLPLLTLAWSYCENWVLVWWGGNVLVDRRKKVTIIPNTFFMGSPLPNPVHVRLNWFLEKKIEETGEPVLSQTNVEYIRTGTRIDPDGRMLSLNLMRPVYDTVSCNDIVIFHNGKEVTIRHGSPKNASEDTKNTDSKKTSKVGEVCDTNLVDPKSHLILLCEDLKVIKSFISHINTLHEDWVKNAVFKPTSYSLKGVSWNSNSIAVKRSRDKLFLDQKVEDLIFGPLESFVKSETFCGDFGCNYKIGFLFYGVPGCGKTSTAYTISQEYKMGLYKLNLNMIENAIQLKSAVTNIPNGSVVVFDDIDCVKITHSREDKKGNEKDTEKSKTEELADGLNEFVKSQSSANLTLADVLDVLDGNEHLYGCIIVFTSNHPEKLDKALIRPGRIDHQIRFGPADFALMERITRVFYERTGIDKEVISTVIEDLKKKLPSDFEIAQANLINTFLMRFKSDIDGFFKNMISNFAPEGGNKPSGSDV